VEIKITRIGQFYRAEYNGISWIDWTPENAAQQVALRAGLHYYKWKI
jgi:hypothetical protein